MKVSIENLPIKRTVFERDARIRGVGAACLSKKEEDHGGTKRKTRKNFRQTRIRITNGDKLNHNGSLLCTFLPLYSR